MVQEPSCLSSLEAADIWSLGCLFFELFTGRFLFEEHLWLDVSHLFYK